MTESAVTNTKNLGCVKWFNGKRGYGFITDVDTSARCFCSSHRSCRQSKIAEKIFLKGEYVEYSLTAGEDGVNHASSVTGVRGGPPRVNQNAEDMARRRSRRARHSAEGSSDVIFAESS